MKIQALFVFATIFVTAIILQPIHSSGRSNPNVLVQEEEKQQEQEDKRMVIPNDEHSVARRDFMRTKLLYAQNILEGLTTGDFELIENSIEEIDRVTEGEHWIAIDNQQYRRLTEDFKTAVARMKAAASEGNIEATALRYYQMSTSCIDCHQHVRKAEYEF